MVVPLSLIEKVQSLFNSFRHGAGFRENERIFCSLAKKLDVPLPKGRLTLITEHLFEFDHLRFSRPIKGIQPFSSRFIAAISPQHSPSELPTRILVSLQITRLLKLLGGLRIATRGHEHLAVKLAYIRPRAAEVA